MIDGPREVEFKGKNLARKKRPQVELYKCIRCGLCERHCPTGSIHLEHEHAGTGTDRDSHGNLMQNTDPVSGTLRAQDKKYPPAGR